MNYLSQLLILISALTLWMPALGRSSAISGPTPLVLNDEQSEYPLGQHMEILEDPAGELTIQDVSSSEYSDRFVPSMVEAPNFGFTNSVYWVRFRLRNESQATDHWLLELGFPNIHYVALYIPTPDGEGYLRKQTGVLQPFKTRDIADRHIVFNLPLPPGEELTFYMCFQSGASMTLPLTLWSPAAFLQESGADLLFLGMFYGVFLIMLVYNLFLLYSLRDASYLYFVCFLASGLLLIVSYDGVADQYLWPDLPTLNRYSVPLLFIFFMTSMIMFTDAFLEAKTRNRTLHWLIKFVLVGWGMFFLLVPFTSYRFILSLIVPFGVLTFGMLGFAGILSWRRGYRPARYFLFSWMGVIIGGIIILAVRLELIPSTAFTEQFFRLGIIWLVAFWAIALADRINLLKAEKEKANLEVQAGEARYRELVETMSDGLGVIDESGRFTYANDRLAEMLGYQADEIRGLLVTELADEENQQLLTEQLATRKTGVTTPYELTWRRKDSSEVFTIVSPMPIFGAEGQYQGAFAIITDITERVQASRLLEERVADRTRELQDARTQINTLFNNSPLGIAVVTLEGDVLAANQAFRALTGFSEDELVGKNIRTLYAHPEQRESVLDQLGAERSLSNYSLQLRRKDGSIFHTKLNLNQLEMAGQQVLLGIIDDVTEQVEARETISTLHQMSYDLITITDLQTLIDHAVPHLHEIVDFQRAALMLTEEGNDTLTIYGYMSPTLPPEFIVHQVPVDSWPSLRAVMDGRETSYLPDMQASEVLQAELDSLTLRQWAASLKTSRSWLSLPLLAGKRTIGLLNILHNEADYYDANDIELAQTFANQFAAAIDNIHLNKQTQLTAAASERSRIARELHDSVTQTLFSASVLAEATPRIWNKDRNIAQRNMEKLSVLIRGALAEMRSLLLELRSDSATEQSLSQLLNTLVEGARTRSNMTITMTIEGDRDPPVEVTMTIYRVAQEIINNAIKHAEATRADITLVRNPTHVEFRVWDDGRGFDPNAIPAGHMGISIMAERVSKIGGDFQIQSRAGHGTEVNVTWFDPKGQTSHA